MPDDTQTAIDDVLDTWLAGGETELFEPPADQEQADRVAWALRKVDGRVAEVDDVVRRRVDALTTWRNQQLDQLHARRAHLEQMLEGWARTQHALDKSRKTWKLPCGLIPKLRPRQPRLLLEEAPMPELVDKIKPLVPAAIKSEERVLPGLVKDATEAGELTPMIDTPEGYEARQAIIESEVGDGTTSYTVVPGVVLLVPIAGPAGQQFSIQRPKDT